MSAFDGRAPAENAAFMWKPWRCRVGLHNWRKAFTPDNEKYLQCARCGDSREVQTDIPNVGGGY